MKLPLARCACAAFLIALLLTCVTAASSGSAKEAPLLTRADTHFRQKSFGAALKAYCAALAVGSVPAARLEEVRYRIVVGLARTEQWNRALSENLGFIVANRHSVWEARGLYHLGHLYLSLPPNGYRVGVKVYRGDNVPRTAAGATDRPRRVSLSEQDRRDAREALEAARILYSLFHSNLTVSEEVQLDFDLAHVLTADARYIAWQTEQKWPTPGDPSLDFRADERYSPDWIPPKRILFLYSNIRRLVGASAHSAALSLLDEALWLRAYQAEMRGRYAVRYDQDKSVVIPFPYDRLDPLARLRQIVREFQNDPIRGQTGYLLGSLLEQGGEFKSAAVQYRSLVAEHPTSKWASDCRNALEQLAHRNLSLFSDGVYYTNKPAKLLLASRNVATVRLALYRVDLERLIRDTRRLHDPNLSITSTADLLRNTKAFLRTLRRPDFEWTRSPGDTGDYRPRSNEITLPIRRPGAYLLVARAPGIQAVTLVTVTNLALVQIVDRDRALFFAADASTGGPTPGVDVLVREWYSEQNANGESVQRIGIVHGVTGSDGTVSVPILRKPNRSGYQIAAFARCGSNYALTQQVGCSESDNNQGRFKTYGTTDRAVYRPHQTIQFREVVMERRSDGIKPLVGSRIHVEARDAGGRRIYAALLTSSEFGSVNGHFALPAGAALGEYSLVCSVYKVESSTTDNGASRFRVEEYKKPEFQVTVTPAAERVRLGQPASATVTSRYYFGGPAVNAIVSYRLYRTSYAQSYRFPEPFDFLYENASQGDYDTSYRNGEVTAHGTARTDQHGEAKITFPTRAYRVQGRDQDLNYVVEADVRDSSRHTISGSGSVKATRHDVAVFLNYPHGYAHSGDHVPVEIVTLNSSDLPVVAQGAAKVFRQPADLKGKESLVFVKPIATDSRGSAILDWTADRAGYYRIAFSTRDTVGQEVEGSTYVWVAGEELSKGEFLNQGVVLAVEQPYYLEGHTAKLLIATDRPNATVLVTRVADNQILEKRLIHVPGRSVEIPIPLGHRDVPNVFISATMVHDGKLFQTSQELLVPPVSQLAKLSVRADRERYQPGEKARLSLVAMDWRDRPLRTELAVAISDDALSYIQKDYTPDIRVFYYGDRRSQSVGSSGSTDTEFQQANVNYQRSGSFKAHVWETPDGMGSLDTGRGGQWTLAAYRTADYGGGMNDVSVATLNNDPWNAAHGVKRRVVRISGSVSGDMISPDYPPSMPKPEGLRRLDAFELGKYPRSIRDEEGPAGPSGYPPVRRQFLDTAFWSPAVITDADGRASVEVTWPDNMTRWRAYTVGNSSAAQVGTADTTIATRKDILVRLEAPRYFVERDTMVLSAIVQNGTASDTNVRLSLKLDGDCLELTGQDPADVGAREGSVETRVDVPKDGEKRVDWTVRVRHPGSVAIQVMARSDVGSDAVAQRIPVLVHGVERVVATSGVLRGGDGRATVPIALPQARKPGTSEVVVQVNPSLAAVMLDALPYLNDYPYGCIEQTMSRFLPSVLTARILKEAGIRMEDLRRRMLARKVQAGFGRGSLHDTNPYTVPDGKPGTAPEIPERLNNAVFDTPTLNRMIAAGMSRIRDYQHSDGGWGWWKDDTSDTWMTAYVVDGLIHAREAGIRVEPSRLHRAEQFLIARLRADDDLQEMTFLARVLALEPRMRPAIRSTAAGRIYSSREKLSAYSKALLALALNGLDEKVKAGIVLENIENTVKVDEQEATAHWEAKGAAWWDWYNDPVETNAAVLRAYVAIKPKSRLAAMLVKWLVNRREGDNWASTRETALAVYALADYVRVNRELAPDYTLTFDLGGKLKRSYHVTSDNALLFDNRFVIPDSLLLTGTQTVNISKRGAGACYYSVTSRYFSQEDSIPAAGNGIYVTRRYYRLLPETVSGMAENAEVDVRRPNPFLTGNYEALAELGTEEGSSDTDSGPQFERAALNEGDTVISGDLIEVELFLEAKNDYSYVAFEDVKPAGCEPVEVRSGEKMGQGIFSNLEFRDQKVVFFLSNMRQGTRSLRYRLRAEAPGFFHALPTNGFAMYSPALRALSAELSIHVRDE